MRPVPFTSTRPSWLASSGANVTTSTTLTATPGTEAPPRPACCPSGFPCRHVVRGARGDSRRHFRAAVALQKFQAQLLAHEGGRRFAQLPPPRWRTAGWRTAPRALARIGGKKRGRRNQQGGAVLLHQETNRLGFGGVGMIDHATAGDYREPQRGGEAERVEKREHAGDAVAFGNPENLRHPVYIGDDAVVREHYALGRAGAAAGE